MSKRARTILFFICSALFFLTVPLVILYSQGYRLDLEKRKIVKTGAFYFKTFPKEAMVFIDRKLEKSTDFFFGATLIENLLPKKYLVSIEKLGRQAWKKNLEIKEAQVTEAKNIILVPEDLKYGLLEKDVKEFSFSPDGRKIVFKKDILDEKENPWTLKLYDLERGIKSHIVDKKQLSEKEVILLGIIWAPDSERIILKTEIEKEVKFFLLDLKESPPNLKALGSLEGAEQVFFHPKDSQKVFFSKKLEGSLVLFAGSFENGSESLASKDMIAYKISEDGIFWMSKDGSLQKSDFSERSQKLNFEPFPIGQEPIEIEVFNSNIFLKESGKLFLLNENLRKFQEIGNNLEAFKISPDAKKICLWNGNEIWLVYLKEEQGQPEKKAGEKIFLTRFSEKIGKVFWLTSHYLIFNVESKIKIVEIDDRDEIQTWDLSDFKNPEIYFNQKDKKLYIFSGENIFVSEKLP